MDNYSNTTAAKTVDSQDSVSLRLNKATGLFFDQDGVLVPESQFASTERSKDKMLLQERERIGAAMQDLRVEIDLLLTRKHSGMDVADELNEAKILYKKLSSSLTHLTNYQTALSYK